MATATLNQTLIGQSKPTNIMTITQIKEQLNLASINFQKVISENSEYSTTWHKAFDKDSRVMIVAAEEVLQAIAANATLSDVALKDEGTIYPEGKEPYRKYYLIRYKEVSYSI